MSTSIDQAFVTMYMDEVHEAYQQRGSKLRNSVRLKEKVVGATCKFQKVGKGTAGQKTRHGNVPLMNVAHSTVTAALADWYGADYCDALDELKTNIDERAVVANAGAFALGRKIDEIIIAAMDATSTALDLDATGLTKGKIASALEMLNTADVPDDGNRFAVVGAHQWEELMSIEEFSSSDFVGQKFPWLTGTESRVWRGVTWMFHSGLPEAGGVRKCFVYHKNALGLAEGQDLKCHIDWVPEKAAHLIDHCISAGAVLIDPTGCVEIACDDEAEIV
ncbi:MAG: hypothetical protein H0S85_07460 [Desulfovibrionaceae bacterium]|nr:hypothetical protein [Desulfovibrionaceae bacterium]